jgi:hypothetical protein
MKLDPCGRLNRLNLVTEVGPGESRYIHECLPINHIHQLFSAARLFSGKSHVHFVKSPSRRGIKYSFLEF